MLRLWAVACALACVAFPARAQTPQSGVRRGMTVEASAGFAYTQFNAPTWPNLSGFYGSVGINLANWLQVYGDESAQYGTVSIGNTRIYGDHFGARFYYRPRYSMFQPFGEALAGASRLDLNVPQLHQRFSEHGFSFKIGGGLDVTLNRHWSVRALDVDYYRTPFLQTHQNNLWIAAGIVFKLGERRYPR